MQGKAQEMATQWAAEVMALSKIVDDLLAKLPDVDSTEEEELSRIVKAMVSNEEAEEALRSESSRTRDLLTEVRDMHAALADAALSSKHSVSVGFHP